MFMGHNQDQSIKQLQHSEYILCGQWHYCTRFPGYFWYNTVGKKCILWDYLPCRQIYAL